MTDRAPVTVLWFRRDLRLADHPALVAAAASAERVVALFVDDERLRRPSGAPRVVFLDGCLDALDADLDGRLVRRTGDPVDVVPAVAREVGATVVHASEDFGPYGRARDEAVDRELATVGAELRLTGSPYAVAPGTVLNQSGQPFKVFTPFSKAWVRLASRRHPVGVPDVTWVDGLASTRPRAVELGSGADLPAAGERAAHDRLDAFLEEAVDDYGVQRDLPATDGTSRLSPHLKFGTLHPRQILDHLAAGRVGHDKFRSELAWREFYADVLFHRPDTVRRAFNPKMAAMRVDAGPDADARFAAWCEGRTGFPFVDAGMRQLAGEAWMHNRVRMVVASFLVKDLHVDWARGAAFFLEHLVDGDLASNQHGWQWVAGTGTDAAPYFRVFNPVAQGRRFDPDGDYVRRWVPELAGVPGADVHEPWALPTGAPLGYPDRIVDHAAERAEALRRYDEIR
ncbi:MAG TPA: deoxyribodipyrimidine photo-lyase [Acidimicrobiales bacterium]|nr:deoxyribodipyrimidine photo-lyase [Acidimicrobiales bacterium]